MTPAGAARLDIRTEVTESIIKMLEQGTAPWRKPWKSGAPAPFEMPFNPTTARSYKGGNALHLMAVASAKGYGDTRWVTYRQAAEYDWQVRRGEKGTHIEFWRIPDLAPNVGDNETASSLAGVDLGGTLREGATNRLAPIHRVYTVFNGDQIDGIPKFTPKVHQEWAAVQAGERILENSGAIILHTQRDRAFYNPRADIINLPPAGTFENATGYYATALHELGHWTGHSSRLNRESLTNPGYFGDPAYAREELRAELASVFLAAERGIPYNPEQNAAYIGSWIKTLREDKHEIFRAARDAHRAADLLIALDRGLTPEQALRDVMRGDLTAVSLVDTDTLTQQIDSGLAHGPSATLPQISLSSSDVFLGLQPRRETAEWVAQYEPGSQTVDITEKDDATEHRSPTASAKSTGDPDQLGDAVIVEEQILDDEVQGRRPVSEQELEASLHRAEEITKANLGADATTLPAATDSGTYRGEVLGDTEYHLVQGVTAKSAVAHPKDLLNILPAAGDHVRITYSNSLAQVAAFEPLMRSKGLSR